MLEQRRGRFQPLPETDRHRCHGIGDRSLNDGVVFAHAIQARLRPLVEHRNPTADTRSFELTDRLTIDTMDVSRRMAQRHDAVDVTAHYSTTPYFFAVSVDDSTSCNPTNNRSMPATLITTSPVMMAPRSSTRLTSSASESCSSGLMASGRSFMLHEAIRCPGPGEAY